MNRIDEATRKRVFRREPMAREFLSVMLQDLQYTENDEACTAGREARDTGTIYSCPDSTFRAALRYCERFRAYFDRAPRIAAILARCEDQAGSDLYLRMAGHGAGFGDRNCWHEDGKLNELIGDVFDAKAIEVCGRLECYLGDDGVAYICGKESA